MADSPYHVSVLDLVHGRLLSHHDDRRITDQRYPRLPSFHPSFGLLLLHRGVLEPRQGQRNGRCETGRGEFFSTSVCVADTILITFSFTRAPEGSLS